MPTEEQKQITLIEWASYQPEIRDYLFHIPNGGSRHILEAKKLKKMGTKRGVPDLFLAIPTKCSHGLFIEMKNKKGGTVSEAQLEMIKKLRSQGYDVVMPHGYDEAVRLIKCYLHEQDFMDASKGVV